MSRHLVVLDTDVVISVMKVGRTDLVANWPCYDMTVTDLNVIELSKPETRAPFEGLLSDGTLRVYEIRHPDALEHFALMRKKADLGESGVVAAVIHGKGSGLSNDEDAIKVAAKHSPPVFLGDLRDLLVRCFEAGRVNAQDIANLQTACKTAGVFVPFTGGFGGAEYIAGQNWLLPPLPIDLLRV